MADDKTKKVTKADFILSRVEKLTQQTARLESRMNETSNDAVMRKLSEENAKLRQDVQYLSVQLESVCSTITKMLQRLPDKIQSAPAQKLDVDDLSSRVAAKIIIPESALGDIDTDALADKLNNLGTAAPVSTGAIDYDELGASVAKKLYIPQAVAEEVNYEQLAEKVAQMLPPVNVDYEELGTSVAKKMYVPQAIAEEVDYDLLADKVASRIPALESLAGETAYTSAEPVAVQPEIDYDELAQRLARIVPAAQPVVTPVAVQAAPAAIDYDAIASRLSGLVPAQTAPVQAEIDYDALAAKVAEVVSVREPVSADYIAARVAEQIVIPQQSAAMGSGAINLDVEELSRKVADKIAIPAYEPAVSVNELALAEAVAEKLKGEEVASAAAPMSYDSGVDEELLAENIANRLNFSLSDELIASAVVKNLAGAIDSDEIADCVAKRVGSISPEQFEIDVDDDGCDSLAKAVCSKLDYDFIASAVAEKLNPAFMASASVDDLDAEEIAKAISEKLSVSADFNEDVLADKAAAILSNYLPEIDSDDIADKVIAGVIPALPSTPVIDSEGIAAIVTERIVENQESGDYDIVIDEEGLGQITENVSSELAKDYEERYARVDEEIDAIKEEYGTRFDRLDEDVAEIRELLLSGAVVASKIVEEEDEEEEPVEEELVEEEPEEILEEEPEEEIAEAAEEEEEVVEEPVEEPVEEQPEEQEVVEEEPEEVLVTVSDIVGDEEPEEDEEEDETLDDLDESLSDAEIMPDGIPGISGGVDFANMMKYNRSFIARIIQGSDEQKVYYGQVKTALLSYKKVNSNVAWGAERFNKGRETIARFKIRGKTLCLYLALDPNDYSTSVYHHADVSDNKSMRGTPMMVKIKSPLGVKKAVRLIDDMMYARNGEKRHVAERDYAAMYPYESMEELIEDGLVKDVSKK